MATPRRSIRRPWKGAPAALPSASAPVQTPAAANEPVTSRTYSSVARPLIPIGSRPISVANTISPTPGVRRMRA